MNNAAAKNSLVHASNTWTRVSLGNDFRSSISKDTHMFEFTKLSSKMFIPVHTSLHHCLVLLDFFLLTNLVDIQWYFIILLCIYPITNVAEHLFTCIGHLNFLFSKVVYQITCPFFFVLSFYYCHGNSLCIILLSWCTMVPLWCI